MTRKRTIVVGALLALSVVLSGCTKKKPPLPPPQAQAPTITDTNVPSTIPEVPVPQPEPEATPTKPAPTVSKKPRQPRKIESKKIPPATQPAAPGSADKTVVEEGSKQPDAPQPPLIASENPQAAQLRADTNQLLGASEFNVNNLHRTLSKDDQAIVLHIRSYIDQSRQAMKDGDIERAHTLAIKAHLMSDELTKK